MRSSDKPIRQDSPEFRIANTMDASTARGMNKHAA